MVWIPSASCSGLISETRAKYPESRLWADRLDASHGPAGSALPLHARSTQAFSSRSRRGRPVVKGVWKTADPRCGDDLPLGELLAVGPPRKPDGTEAP